MADVHIGSWRDPKLKDLSVDAFIKSSDICIKEKVDFVLISGDLFNTALPSIDGLKSVVREFRKLKNNGIPVYIIPGSHDYSPSGKTMIDVLEEADLLKNVFKGSVVDGKLKLRFTTDEKTGVKITGILGRRGTLERLYYQDLDIESLEKEQGKKIFMFHTSITELKQAGKAAMESTDISYLPRGFDYYAGGHVHIVNNYSFKQHKHVVYPGPLFPANFEELEALDMGGFFIYDNGQMIREGIHLKNTFKMDIDCEHKSPEEVEQDIYERIKGKEFINTIILIRVSGRLKTGKVSDINFREIFSKIYSQGAFYIMRNTTKVVSAEYEEIQMDHKDPDEVEDGIIREHLGQIRVNGVDADKELQMTKDLMDIMSGEKHEGEKVYEYEERVKKEVDRLLEM
jgi:hypothetical protein